jgi:hypothetical protein
MRAILAAYEKAREDPKAVIPTPLMLAIENAKRLQQSASPYEDRRRHERTCRPDHDMAPWGEHIRPGQ